MKTNNLTLGICAFTLAVGSALASFNLAVVNYNAAVTYTNIIGGQNCPPRPLQICEQINRAVACDVGTGSDCVATIATQSNRKVQNPTCSSIVQESTATSSSATIVNPDYHASCISAIQ